MRAAGLQVNARSSPGKRSVRSCTCHGNLTEDTASPHSSGCLCLVCQHLPPPICILSLFRTLWVLLCPQACRGVHQHHRDVVKYVCQQGPRVLHDERQANKRSSPRQRDLGICHVHRGGDSPSPHTPFFFAGHQPLSCAPLRFENPTSPNLWHAGRGRIVPLFPASIMCTADAHTHTAPHKSSPARPRRRRDRCEGVWGGPDEADDSDKHLSQGQEGVEARAPPRVTGSSGGGF